MFCFDVSYGSTEIGTYFIRIFFTSLLKINFVQALASTKKDVWNALLSSGKKLVMKHETFGVFFLIEQIIKDFHYLHKS